MKRRELKALLKYETKLLRWGRKFETALKAIGLWNAEFSPNLPQEDYEILTLVLDNLEVPPDCEFARDSYNNIYYDFWNGISNNFEQLLKLFEETKNENKKRIRK